MKKISRLMIGCLFCISSMAQAEIWTCSQLWEANKTAKENCGSWTQSSRNGLLRAQVEATAKFYVLHNRARGVDWDEQPSVEEIAAMSNEELDEFGEGICVNSLSSGEVSVQFGFGGGNWLALVFNQDNDQLATRILDSDAGCEVLDDLVPSYVSHLPKDERYSDK